MDNKQKLKWRFDVSTFRLIGRDLITDRVTAIFELVKNCYDANAQNVHVFFESINDASTKSIIRIEDDGYGMSFEDIRDKWMVIGTSSKRAQPYSPKPYNRKCVGEKGIGRFAVDKLGDKTTIITKKRGTDKWLQVDIDWTSYQGESDERNLLLFTDIENDFSYKNTEDIEASGTKLIISSIRESWTKKDIEHLTREISRIASPFANLSFPFNVRIQAPEYDIDLKAIKSEDDFDLATASFKIDFDINNKQQQSIYYNEKDNTFSYHQTAIKSFGGIKMRVYYFDENARRSYRKKYPNDPPIDGFKIYRDGIIATPFAEAKENADEKRDILGIDKRLWQDIFSRVSSREFIGIIDITKEENPKIIDATNRQDFVDNEEYRELKKFIITQLQAIQDYKEHIRKINKTNAQLSLQTASNDIGSLMSALNDIVDQKPDLKPTVDPLVKQVRKTDRSVKTAISEQKKALEDFTRKENIYMSIMSLQQFAITVTHAVRTTLNQIRDRVEFFYRYYPDEEEEELFKLYSKEMYERFKVLNRVINYMLSYSQSNLNPEEVDLKETFTEILNDYDDIFSRDGIVLQTDFPEKIALNSNRQFFRDILQNLIDNSVKAMKSSSKKEIRCSYEVQNDVLEILVSDTGIGIPPEEREQVFALYFTTTENQGGAGVGLYIVKTRVQSLGGSVEVVDSEFGSIGTTIKITIPLKK